MNFIKLVFLCLSISYVCTCVTTSDVPLLSIDVPLLSIDVPLLTINANPHLLDTATNPFTYLEEKGYPYENHTIITEDGYILLLVRIPHDINESSTNTTRPPVLFVHGIFSLFYDFLNSGPGEAIGFEVLENGYDIWLLNVRGNTYSRRHVTLDPDLNAAAFWNFSWHEAGLWDVPAAINYITDITGFSNISYVGHSQGTTMFLAMAASRPEYNAKINLATLLAPVAYMANAQFPLLLLLKNNIELAYAIGDILQLHEVLPYNEAAAKVAQLLCNIDSPALAECGLIYEAIYGQSNQINYTMLSVAVTNSPAGGSAKELLHFLQNAHSGGFQLYDYGKTGNQVAYNQTAPPSYNLTAITAPVALLYGQNDLLVSVIDATRLAGELPNLVINNIIPFVGTNHVDLLWGTMDVPLVHKPVISLLNQYNNL